MFCFLQRIAADDSGRNMQDIFNNSGFGWSDSEEQAELREQSNRFLLIRRQPEEEDGPLVVTC